MGRSRYRFIHPDQPHFLTVSVLHWLPVFTRPESVNILLSSLQYLCSRGLRLYAWVVLEDHLHLIAQSAHLARDIARFKSWTARQLIDYLQSKQAPAFPPGAQERDRALLHQLAFYKKPHKTDRRYQFWQEGVHPEWIHSREMMRQKIEYVHHNPVKRGYVLEAAHWPYSSARAYSGGGGPLEVCLDW